MAMIDELLLPSLVARFATAYHAGNLEHFSRNLAKIHDHPKFTRAFHDTMPGLLDKIPDLDILGLKRAMAASTTISSGASSGGRAAVAEYQLFFLPLVGPASAVARLAGSAAALSSLSASFREHGLVAEGSRALALPFAVDAERAGTLTSWSLRAAVRAAMPLLQGRAGRTEPALEALSAVFGMDPLSDHPHEEPDRTVTCLLPVARLSMHPRDGRADDPLSPASIDDAEDSADFRRWRKAVALLDGDVAIGEPCSWSRACAMAAISIAECGLAAASVAKRLSPPAYYDRLSIDADDDHFHIRATHGGIALRTVSLPMQLSLADFGFLADALSDMAREVMWNDDDPDAQP
jgi:hypothetical protein